MEKLDPITYEVVSHRLWQINDEAGVTLKNVSGSPICTESNDFNVGIFLPDGSLVVIGAYVTHFVATMPFLVKSTLDVYLAGEGIKDGDMFVMNDPYLGAVHPSDVAILSPVFIGGQLLCWTGAAMHMADIGAMEHAGMSPRATEIFHDGLLVPPVKIVEGGRLRDDILRLVCRNVREPLLVAMDLKSQVAANNVARQRLGELAARYGVDVVRQVMEEMISSSEVKLRARLRELPDGTYSHVDYADHDGCEDKLYKVICTMTKKGDELTFDFTGTDREGPGLINCNYASTWAGLYAAMCALLCYDIPWNQGILNPIKVIAPLGSIVNCQFPAPCSMSSIGTSFNVINVATICISRMLGLSEKYHGETMATWASSWPAMHSGGISQFGEFCIAYNMDPTSGSGGARSYRDGVDSGGLLPTPTPRIQNVEGYEAMYPFLYVFRRHLTDSGGPGKFRGGVAVESMLTVHDSEWMNANLAGMGAETLQGAGLFGGYPGSAVRYIRVRESGILERLREGRFPESAWELGGEPEVLPQKLANVKVRPGDVMYLNMSGGGGYGDPLERDPDLVLKDVKEGLVTKEMAAEIYGVVLEGDPPGINQVQTQSLRSGRRAERLGERPQAPLPGEGKREGLPIQVDWESGTFKCGRCGGSLGRIEEGYKRAGVSKSFPLWRAGPVRGKEYDKGRLRLREYYCPCCAALLECEVSKVGDPAVVSATVSRLGTK